MHPKKTIILAGILILLSFSAPLSALAASFPEGMVTLTFDDGRKSQYNNALPILNAAGLKATFFVMSRNDSSFMSRAQIRTLDAQGHEIGSHSVTHPHLTKVSRAHAKKEIENSKETLENILEKKIVSFAYPYGEFDSHIAKLVEKAGYRSARTIIGAQDGPAQNEYALRSYMVMRTDTAAKVKRKIDSAIANKKWLILTFHDVNNNPDNYSTTPEIFKEIVDYIQAKGVKVVTIKEGVRLMDK